VAEEFPRGTKVLFNGTKAHSAIVIETLNDQVVLGCINGKPESKNVIRGYKSLEKVE
jgi:hypothetical protein